MKPHPFMGPQIQWKRKMKDTDCILDFVFWILPQVALKCSDASSALEEIVSAMTEAIGVRSQSDGVTVSCHFALSEAIQNVFHIGAGAGKLDFTSKKTLPCIF
jgi:hypothetical protein